MFAKLGREEKKLLQRPYDSFLYGISSNSADKRRRAAEMARAILHQELEQDYDWTDSAIQKADLVCLFPKIEQCRFAFLRKHRDILARYLPIRNIEGELIDDPMELEVTHVSYLIRNRPALQSLPGADLIILCANVRNQIAHNQPVPYATLLTLEHCI